MCKRKRWMCKTTMPKFRKGSAQKTFFASWATQTLVCFFGRNSIYFWSLHVTVPEWHLGSPLRKYVPSEHNSDGLEGVFLKLMCQQEQTLRARLFLDIRIKGLSSRITWTLPCGGEWTHLHEIYVKFQMTIRKLIEILLLSKMKIIVSTK